MKSQYLSDAYEAKVLPLGKNGRWAKRESDGIKSTKEQLWDLAEFEHCDMIVVGNHGRKGPKNEETVCGTVVEFLALNSKFPILIIKDYRPRTVKPDGCLRWGVCYDSSSKSKKALHIVLNLMKKLDKLVIIHVHEEDNALSTDVVKQFVEHEAKSFGIIKMEIVVLDKI